MTEQDDVRWLPARMEAVALRLARADEAAFQIGATAMAWSRNAFDFDQIDNESGQLDFVLKSIRPIPPTLMLLFSEALHHLRAAVENTLFELVEARRAAALPSRQAHHVKMPVYEQPAEFARWQSRAVDAGVVELGAGTVLGDRVASLQPYSDVTATVPSLKPELASLMGTEPVFAHPMVLLQKYSNTDKHRSIRIAAAHTTVIRDDVPFGETDRSMKPVDVGDVLTTTLRDAPPTIVEVAPSLLVERPQPGVWVAPGVELDHLFRHVSQVVIPTLITGLALTRSIPPQIELGDTGQSWAERISDGGWTTAKQRTDALVPGVLREANSTPPIYRPPSTS